MKSNRLSKDVIEWVKKFQSWGGRKVKEREVPHYRTTFPEVERVLESTNRLSSVSVNTNLHL